MSILKPVVTPSGVELGFHLVTKFDWWYSSVTIGAEVRSWLNRESWEDGNPAVFVWPRISVDPAAIGGGTGDAVESALVQDPQSVFFGGAQVSNQMSDLQKRQNQVWAMLKMHRDRVISSPLSTEHGDIQAAPADRLNIMIASVGALAAQQLGEPSGTDVILADNTVKTLSATQLAAVALQFRQRDLAAREHCQVLRGWLFDPRASVATVNSLDWSTVAEPAWEAPSEVGQVAQASAAAAPVIPTS